MKYVYEFIGAFFLVFTVGMTVLSPHEAGPLAPLAIGSILAVMVFAGGHISGGHYNPAISFSVFLNDKLSWQDLIKYWIAQLAAAIVAAYLTLHFKGNYAEAMVFNKWDAFIAEFIFTFALCYVVLNVAISSHTKGNSYFGFAIGFTVLAGAYAVGSISGGAFNPAVALGLTILNVNIWANIWVYLCANLLGGLVAAYLFKATQEKNRN
jgi:aquaporin Z